MIDSPATPSNSIPRKFRLIPAPWSLLVAVIATLLVIVTIDAGGRGTSRYLDAPGITLDESFNLQQGYLLWGAVRLYGWKFFNPISQMEIYGDELYLEDHPPLGRWWIGAVHEFLRMTLGSDDNLEEAYGRTGSALAYGLLLYLAGYFATRWWGMLAGIFCPFCIATMPRIFGHAHLASLESCVNLTYCLTVFYLVDRWANFRVTAPPPTDSEKSGWMIPGLSMRTIFISGILLGMTLLTKIQGVFLPIPLAIYAFCIWRKQALVPVFLFGLIGVSFFFLCWPYLWLEPVDHLLKYLGRTTDRITIHNYYLGQIYDDRQTPWHYPWIMFAAVVPFGFIIAATVGVIQKIRTEKRVLLLLINTFFPLLVFTLPVAKYDGDRLFLMVFPIYGMLAGYGLQLIFTSQHQYRMVFIVFQTVMSIIFPLTGLVLSHPHQINAWNFITPVFGISENWESNYWSDGLSAKFMLEVNQHLEPNSVVYLAPVLHQFQIKDQEHQHKMFSQKNISLLPLPDDQQFLTAAQNQKSYILCFYRKADLQTARLSQLTEQKHIQNIIECRTNGTLRATLYEIK